MSYFNKIFPFFLSMIFSFSVYGSPKLKVVTSFSILKDITENIGKDLITVKTIVGPNEDTHVYNPTPQDSQIITQADLVIINGLNFETWIERLIKATGYKGVLITASEGIPFHKMMEPKFSNKPVPDPHVWGDVSHVKVWVKNITKALQKKDPEKASLYEKNACAYLESLQKLDLWIKKQFKGLRKESCKVITAHDAFNYFEQAYGLVFLAPQGLSTLDEPSALEMVALIKQIKKENISTIFVENISSQHLIKQLASETGATIGGTLYSDALSSPTEPAGTYINMMRHNVMTLRKSIKCLTQGVHTR